MRHIKIYNTVLYRPITCPKCGTKKVRCYGSHLSIRYYKCKICHYNFKAEEVEQTAREFNRDCKIAFEMLEKIKKERKSRYIGSISGKNSPLWKGGRIKDGRGYIWVKVPKGYLKANLWGYIAEHRFIMEKYLGRFLRKKEVVHHLNGDHSDNRLENLKLCKNNAEHRKLHKKSKSAIRNDYIDKKPSIKHNYI